MLALRLWKRSDKNYRQSHFCPWSSSTNNAERYSQTAGALLLYCDLSILVRASFSWRWQSHRGIFHRSLQKSIIYLADWGRHVAMERNVNILYHLYSCKFRYRKFFNQFEQHIKKCCNLVYYLIMYACYQSVQNLYLGSLIPKNIKIIK